MSLDGPSPVRRFGPYALVQLSGAGGMGRVDLALRPDRAGLCVIKRLLPGPRTREHEKRFRREANLARRLSHDAIAHTLDVEEVEGELCIVQEFVHGVTLAQLENRAASKEPLPVPLSLHICAEVARALAYAHSFHGGIVHRDIAPDNVMISFGGEVKLVDFGIAKSLQGEETLLTEVGRVLGRPVYTAPEVAAGQTATPRSDIYSLGVVLWQSLTGRTFPDIGSGGGPAPPSALNPAVPAEADSVILAAVAGDLANRFESAEALHGALRRLMPAEYDGRRSVAEFLRLHFSVDLERRLLDEDIGRARAALSARNESSGPRDELPADGTEHRESPRVYVPRAKGRFILIGSLAVLIAAVSVARLLSRPAPGVSVAPDAAKTPSKSLMPPKRPEERATVPHASENYVSTKPASSESTRSVPARRSSGRRVSTPKVDGRDTEALIRFADSRLATGELAAALAAARDAVRAGGGERAHLVLGRVLLAQGQFALAEQEFLHALRLDSANRDAARYLAVARREMKQGDQR